MRFSRSLSVYIGKSFATWCAGTYGALIGLIALLETIELLRRTASRDVGIGLILEMVLLKLPLMTVEAAPFVILLGGMLAFAHLNRTQELVIVWGSGISIWQFLVPPFIITFLTGCFLVVFFSPLSSATTLRLEYLENTYLKGQSSFIRISGNGLWLRQADKSGQSVIHANRLNPENMVLNDAMIIRFNAQGQFIERKDASQATLKNNHWLLEDVLTTTPDHNPVLSEKEEIKTNLTPEKIKESFASPKVISFWDLPEFIESMQNAGFSAIKYRLYWYSMLAKPFLLCAMVLIAAVFSVRITRSGGITMVAITGIMLGFLFHFLSNVVYALGSIGSLPVLLAAWAPVTIISLLGLALLMHLEDG